MPFLNNYYYLFEASKSGQGYKSFWNAHGLKLTRLGVTYISQKYIGMAQENSPEMRSILRRTTGTGVGVGEAGTTWQRFWRKNTVESSVK